MLFKAARPTLLNGIEDVIGRPDLADRAIFLTLGPIREEQRRSETELWREFELVHPAILGALLDAAAHGLKALGSVHLGRLPRMTDFALWATACETSLWPAGTFTRAYTANRKAAIEGIIDADPIAACVRELMSERSSWTGSAADLLRISVERTRQTSDRTGWPKNPRALAGHLRRAQTFLRTLGIDITFSREGRAGIRVIRMRTSPKIPSAPASTKAGPNPAQNNSPGARQIPFVTKTVELARVQPWRWQVWPQTMLTVLTQRPAFLSGNWDRVLGKTIMTSKLMLKVCSVAALVLLAFIALGPAEWTTRSGLGWEIDHFAGYFALTLMFCLAWPRPLVVGGALMAFAVLLEGLQAFTPSLVLLCRGVVQRSRGAGGGSDCWSFHPIM